MTARTAPRLATRILKVFCSTPDHETVIGDLTEQYQKGHGSLWYWRQTFNIVSSELYRRALRRPLVRKYRIPSGQDFVLVPKEASMKRHSGINTTHVTGEGLSGLPGLIITLLPPRIASLRLSSRKPCICCDGPWQSMQYCFRIG